jgi:hypothetical protein
MCTSYRPIQAFEYGQEPVRLDFRAAPEVWRL